MKNFIRRTAARNEVLNSLFQKLNAIRQGISPWPYKILFQYAHFKPQVNFIQIGSNNGINGDPIHTFIKNNDWNGILVEPVPYLFSELKNTYRDQATKLFFENSAVAPENGRLKFYRLKKTERTDVPEWYEQLGSFNKEVIIKHRSSIPGLDDLLIEDQVNAITFTDLVKKYNMKEINLIHIDTEGFDYEILKMIPFSNMYIDFVMFEHKHLSKSDYKRARTLLKRNNYRLGTVNDADTVAIKKDLIRHLTPKSS